MGWWDQLVRFGETNHLAGLGARAAVYVREGAGPLADGSGHPVLRKYAAASGLELELNTAAAVDTWIVITKSRLLFFRPGPFRNMPSELLWEESLRGASLVWWEYEIREADPVVMLHITYATKRLTLVNVHLDDDGDVEGFIDAFGAHAAAIDSDLARSIRAP